MVEGKAAEREVLDPMIHIMAATIDHPSVYMGGPSEMAIRLARRIVSRLELAGYIVVEAKENKT